MFGLFDPPDRIIQKKIPAHMQMEYNAVLSFVDISAPDIPEKKRACLRGIIGSIWAWNSVAARKFSLSDFDIRYIKNLGLNYSKLLSDDEEILVSRILDMLIEKNLIPSLAH